MRLIDAEALKKAMDKKALDLANGGMIFIESIKHTIDNAPTVEPEITEEQAIDTLHKTGWLIIHDKEMSERPQGEWIEVEKQGKTGDGRIFTYTVVVCSECGEQFDLEGEKFCPHCGADMRGDNNEQ